MRGTDEMAVDRCNSESLLSDEELVIKAEDLARASLCPEVPVAFSAPPPSPYR